jgi:hypothetical protein
MQYAIDINRTAVAGIDPAEIVHEAGVLSGRWLGWNSATGRIS